MSRNWTSEPGRIAAAITPDGLELTGFLVSANEPKALVVHLHGQYENALLPQFVYPLIASLKSTGMAAILADTRARDYLYYFRHYSNASDFTWAKEGGSYEIFANCDSDIDGWLEFVREKIPNVPVFLSGHSHGALKVAWYLARRPEVAANLRGGILLSPSDDVGMQKEKLADRYAEALSLAKKMVEKGQKDDLMPTWTYNQPIAAKMYVDMFDYHSELAIMPFTNDSPNGLLNQIQTRLMVIFGERDAASAGIPSAKALNIIEENLPDRGLITSYVVAGADHHYRGKEDNLCNCIVDWIDNFC